MISGNPVSKEEDEWTFGQVLAMFLLWGPTVELVKEAWIKAWLKFKAPAAPQAVVENQDSETPPLNRGEP